MEDPRFKGRGRDVAKQVEAVGSLANKRSPFQSFC